MSTDVSFDDESSLCDQNPLSDHDILADPQPGPGEVEIDTTISHDTTQNIDILLEQMDDILQIGTARDDLDTTIMLPHYPIPTLEGK